MRATPPSSRFAIRRSWATSQSAPTPRQSHWNTPSHLSSAWSSSASVWPFWPSVSRIAWWIASGLVSISSRASSSHLPIAVPPPACIRLTASLASSRVVAEAAARPSLGG